VRRLFFLGFAPLKFFDLEIVTSRAGGERKAVSATVRYFTGFGREIGGQHRLAYQQFFADDCDKIKPQRIWIERPKGAAFALVELTRTPRGRRIGIAGRVKLTTASADMLRPANIETCRDRVQLERALSEALKAADRALGRRLLARLIYLWQLPEHRQALAVLDDADQLMRSGFPVQASSDPIRSGEATVCFDTLCTRPLGVNVPLSKWLAHEAALVVRKGQQVSAGSIQVPAGEDYLERYMIARLASSASGWPCEEMDASAVTTGANLGWLKADEIKIFLARMS